jgi:hypothetical protein
MPTKNEHEDARELHGIADAHCIESARIEFLLQRDGAEATLIWVQRTLVIYRRALLNRKHFAHSSEYRRKFVASCLSFRSWLALNGDYGNGKDRADLEEENA